MSGARLFAVSAVTAVAAYILYLKLKKDEAESVTKTSGGEVTRPQEMVSGCWEVPARPNCSV